MVQSSTGLKNTWKVVNMRESKKDIITKDAILMTTIVRQICEYAVRSRMEPDDALLQVADNIVSLLETSTFNNWGRG